MPVRAYHPQGSKGQDGEKYDEIDRVVFGPGDLPEKFKQATRLVIHADVPEHGAGAGEYDLGNARGEHTGLTVWVETPARPGGKLDYAAARELYLLMIDQQRSAGYQSKQRAKRTADRGDRTWTPDGPGRGAAKSGRSSTVAAAAAPPPVQATVSPAARSADGSVLRVALTGPVEVVLSGLVPGATVPLVVNGATPAQSDNGKGANGHAGPALTGIARVAGAVKPVPAPPEPPPDEVTPVTVSPSPATMPAAAKPASAAGTGEHRRHRTGRRRGVVAGPGADAARRAWTSQS